MRVLDSLWVWLLVGLLMAVISPFRTSAASELPLPKAEISASGTGFVVLWNGYILTNKHVIHGADCIDVWIGGILYQAVVIAANEDTDIALLKVDAQDLASIPLGDSHSLIRGNTVYAVGCPRGICGTVTEGRVANLNVGVGDVDLIMMDLTITHGSSGGPLVDQYGRVVGITSAGLKADETAMSGFSLAVPINIAKSLLEQVPRLPTTPTLGGPLSFAEIVQAVEPAIAYIEVRAGTTISLGGRYLNDPPIRITGVGSLLGMVLRVYPDTIVAGTEAQWSLDGWEHHIEFEVTATHLLHGRGKYKQGGDISHGERAMGIVVQAASSTEAAALLDDLMSRSNAVTISYWPMGREEILDTSTGEAVDAHILTKVLFTEFHGSYTSGAKYPETFWRSGAEIDLLVGMQVGALVVYTQVRHGASYNVATENLPVGVFGLKQGVLVLHFDELLHASSPVAGLVEVAPYSVDLEAGVDINDFLERATSEANAFLAHILAQIP